MKEMGMQAQLRASNVTVIDLVIPPPSPCDAGQGDEPCAQPLVGPAGGVGLALIYEYSTTRTRRSQKVEATLQLPNPSVRDFLTMTNGNGVKHAVGYKNAKRLAKGKASARAI
jgi:hypothetical protein